MSAALAHFQNAPPSGGLWHSLNRLLFTLIVLTVAAIIAYRFLPEVSKRREQQVRIDQLKTEVERERQQLVRNTRIEELLKHDPEYVSIVARDRLDLMKDGETIYRIDPPKPEKKNMRLTH